MRIFAAILATLCLAALAGAQTNGTVENGYTFKNGLWYYPGYTSGYARAIVTSPGYMSCGRYYAGQSYYRYTEVPAQQTPSVTYTPDWKSDLFKLDASLADQQAFQRAYDSLNAKYGFGGQGLIYGNQLYGVNATTQYGYSQSYSQVVQRGYPDADPTVLYQQAFQLGSGAQKFASDATAGHLSLVSQEGDNRARVAQINARAIAARDFLRSLDGPPVVQSRSAVFGPVQPSALVQPNIGLQPADGVNLAALQGSVANRCASCHSGNVKKGGIDMTGFTNPKYFTPEMKAAVWDRLTTADPKRLMPQGGPRLEGPELAEYAKVIFGP